MIAHRAETAFVGAPVGIMDQMVCSLGERSTALFLDTRAIGRSRRVPLPGEHWSSASLIRASRIRTRAANTGRGGRECEEAAALLGVDEAARHHDRRSGQNRAPARPTQPARPPCGDRERSRARRGRGNSQPRCNRDSAGCFSNRTRRCETTSTSRCPKSIFSSTSPRARQECTVRD